MAGLAALGGPAGALQLLACGEALPPADIQQLIATLHERLDPPGLLEDDELLLLSLLETAVVYGCQHVPLAAAAAAAALDSQQKPPIPDIVTSCSWAANTLADVARGSAASSSEWAHVAQLRLGTGSAELFSLSLVHAAIRYAFDDEDSLVQRVAAAGI
jgi:hypothetical protein